MCSRTPLRISFFGGGTDYPEYFERKKGAIVGMAINRYIYISLLQSISFLDYRYRLSYSKLEKTNRVDEIEHPVVRGVLKAFGVDRPLDISIQSDLPANTGLGSSSSFTVGFIHLINTLLGRQQTKLDLAREAIRVERDLLKERVGVQDQLHAAFGGINHFEFAKNRIRVTPLYMTTACQELLADSLVLIYSGLTRHASETLKEQLDATKEKKLDASLEQMLVLTEQAVAVLEGSDPDAMIRELGSMLHEGWMVKKSLSSRISNPKIDEIYEVARRNGAIGGKLSGAGGGGFLLMVVPPQHQGALEQAISPAQVVKIGLDVQGSTMIYS